MRTVKVCLSRPKKFKLGAWAIMKYQGMKWRDEASYSHILIIVEDEDVGELILQASHGLVHSCDKKVFLEENTVIKEYVLPRDQLDIKWLKNQLGKKYGYFQILIISAKYLVGVVSTGNGDKQFICSEYIGKGLKLPWVNDYTPPKDVGDHLESIQVLEG